MEERLDKDLFIKLLLFEHLGKLALHVSLWVGYF